MSVSNEGEVSLLYKRPRAKLAGSIFSNISKPDLNKVQSESYESFLQKGVLPECLEDKGMHAAFQSTFPIKNPAGTIEIEYVKYTLDSLPHDMGECKRRGMTYGDRLKITLRLITRERDAAAKDPGPIVDVKEQDVYLGEMPLT